MSDTELKGKFAELLNAGIDPMRAAMILCSGDTKKAIEISTEWVNDPDVLALLNDDNGLPDKTKFGQFVWERMQRADDKESVQFAKLYAETNGFIVKNQTNINIDKVENMGANLDSITSPEEAAAEYKRMLRGGN